MSINQGDPHTLKKAQDIDIICYLMYNTYMAAENKPNIKTPEISLDLIGPNTPKKTEPVTKTGTKIDPKKNVPADKVNLELIG